MFTSLPAKPSQPQPRSSSGQSGGNDSNDMLRHSSGSEGICATLSVLISSRQSGPAYIAVRTSKTAKNAVPINAATLSAAGFGDLNPDMIL